MERLGKYEIVSEIGRGAMGAVYKARDPFIDRLVALKTITSNQSAQSGLLDRFYQEARSAGALQHPSIVTIYELGHEKNTPFIAMEYIEGESLDRLIEQRPIIPLSVKLGYIVRVCEALAYAHQHNVVHRDVKPANIMITKEGGVKVVDFGIARLADMSMTQPNMVIGSRAYMSPQLYKGQRADARADIWAAGVSLYELLAYQRPFSGDSEAELMFHIITDSPPDLKSLVAGCSDELAHITEKMLQKKVEDRYQSMEDVLHDLEPVWRVAKQETVAGLLTDSQQLVAANDLQRAQALLRKILQIDVGNTQAKSLLEKVTTELRRSQILPKLKEHLERGREFLQTGKLLEAKSQAEAALGLDSRHEPALTLLADVETASVRVQELERKLRLTKQRLAEGALTEAAVALGQALEMKIPSPEVQELQRQIDEERHRRERRKQLGEILHNARTLWTALSYEECLDVLAKALKDFPNEPELMKLQEMARNDLEDLKKQRKIGEVRKLLGQQQFNEAGRALEPLLKAHPLDPTVKNLQSLVMEGQREEERRRKFVEELASLRQLVSNGKFKDAQRKGDTLLREYPDEFELKELVGYVRGEIAEQEQKQKEKDRERQIRQLIEQSKFREAEETALRAEKEYPRQEVFRILAADAGKERKELEEREKTRRDLQRRIEEINRSLRQEKIGDAIKVAEDTLKVIGPDPNVKQLLASAKQQEKKREAAQDKRLSAAQTLVEKKDFAAATAVLNEGIATKLFDPSDTRVQQQLREIEQLSATSIGGSPQDIKAPTKPQPVSGNGAEAKSKEQKPAPSPQPVKTKAERKDQFAAIQAKALELQAKVLPILRRPFVLGGIAGVALLGVLIVLIAGRGPSKKETELWNQSQQLWEQHQFDQSEQALQQLKNMRGRLQKQTDQRIAEIESLRIKEQNRFDQGKTFLVQNDPSSATQAFQDVVNMNLWRAEDARLELASVSAVAPPPTGDAPEVLEKNHFDSGESLFKAQKYDQARREFLAVRTLNLANSTLRPKAEDYLKKIRQQTDFGKLLQAAMQDVKDEKWAEARDEFQQIEEHKEPLSKEAKHSLALLNEEQKTEDDFTKSLQSGSFQKAKTQADAMGNWPKTQSDFRQRLQSIERKRLDDFQNKEKSLVASNDSAGLEHLQDELRLFGKEVDDSGISQSIKSLDAQLRADADKSMDDPAARKELEKAVVDFLKAKQNGDVAALTQDVTKEFQAVAATTKKGSLKASALEYVNTKIPAAVAELNSDSLKKGKLIVPALSCPGGDSSGAAGPSIASAVPCAQLDADSPVQWAGTFTVDYPDSAKQPGKLPYTLKLIITVEATGNVKVDKDGDADRDFLKKARESSKKWKASVPKSGGKPVSTRFPLSLTFTPH